MGMHERLSRRRASAALLLAPGLAMVVLAMVLAADPKSAEAAFPGKNGKIAFTSNRSGDSEIWQMNPDGTSPQNLTSSSLHFDQRAAYSANGKKIAFYSNRGGDLSNFEIYSMKPVPERSTNQAVNSPKLRGRTSVPPTPQMGRR